MNRAYSVLEIKSIDEKSRKFAGIASTPATDRVGDIVEPMGAQFKLPLPFLWQHNSRDPIGWITEAKVSPTGIDVSGEVASVSEPGELQNRLTMAWQMIKTKLVRGLSIGFRDIDSEQIDHSWGTRFKIWEWMETSAVTIPANVEATITAVKSFDKSILAALGPPKSKSSGVSEPKRKNMKTLQEQLAELKEARTVKMARMNEITEIVKAGSREWVEAEVSEFGSLESEIRQLDADIRMKTVESMNAANAKAVSQEGNQDAASQSRGPMYVKKPKDADEKFKGQNFTRMVIARALAHLDQISPVKIAEERWGKTNPTLCAILKTAVEGGTSTVATWALELVASDTRYTGDFIEYLAGLTVFDRLPLREVPANITIKGRDGAATGYWVGEGGAIPATKMTFFDVHLTPLKVAALAVVTNELLRDSTPAAEMLVRDALGQASAKRIDDTFLSNANLSADVYPAGMLYEEGSGVVTPIVSNGIDGASLRADVRDLYAPFIVAKNAAGLQFVMNPALAKAIQLLSNALGLQEFPGINQNGGTLLGDPVVTGDTVNANDLILLKPSDIYRIGDSGVQVSISREAMIEMADGPANNSKTGVTAAGNVVSMFQTESTAIKIVRSINWKKRRAGVVQYIDAAAYGGSAVESS